MQHQGLFLELHGEERFISADSGYRGAQKRKELKDIKADWFITEMPSKVRLLKKHPRINKQPIRTEYIKASIRAPVSDHKTPVWV